MVEHIIGAIKGRPEAEIDADLEALIVAALIVAALAAKAKADKAASGLDPQ